MKGISPDEVDDYAKGGRLEERYPQLEWVSKRSGAKKELAELEFGEYFGNEASTYARVDSELRSARACSRRTPDDRVCSPRVPQDDLLHARVPRRKRPARGRRGQASDRRVQGTHV